MIASPAGRIVNEASRRRVRVENTPTTDGPVAAAKRAPSGDSASAGWSGEIGSQQGRAALTRALCPKPR